MGEYVYLDQLEERIESFHDKFKNSEQFDKLYNEFGWENHEQVTKAYPALGGGAGEIEGYGRGKKINPAWYVAPWFHKVGRVTLPALQHLPASQIRQEGTLGAIMQLPPEEPSVFKFWNAYQLWGVGGFILFSKEIFVIGHDFWHALLFWFGFSFVTSVCVDWWMWWYALRGQEFYDLKFFPLNNKVECIYKLLQEMEQKGSEMAVVKSAHVYGDDLSRRMAAHKFTAAKVDLAYEIQSQLSSKAKAEKNEISDAQSSWKRNAMSTTEKFFGDPKVQADYMKSALENLKKGENAVLKASTEASSQSTVFSDKYNGNFNSIKEGWLAEQRKAGTLPWGFASDADKKKAKKSDKDKQAAIDARLKDLRSRYHAFA